MPFVSQRAIVRIDDLMASSAADHGGATPSGWFVIDLLCTGMTTDKVNLVVGGTSWSTAVSSEGGESQPHDLRVFGPRSGLSRATLLCGASGHHRQQRGPGPAPLKYSGSPLQLDFGEGADNKGVLVVDVEPGLPATVDQVA